MHFCKRHMRLIIDVFIDFIIDSETLTCNVSLVCRKVQFQYFFLATSFRNAPDLISVALCYQSSCLLIRMVHHGTSWKSWLSLPYIKLHTAAFIESYKNTKCVLACHYQQSVSHTDKTAPVIISTQCVCVSVWCQGTMTLTRHQTTSVSSALTQGQLLPLKTLTCSHLSFSPSLCFPRLSL